MSTDGWIDKEYICIYNRILFSHKNRNSAMCHNMNTMNNNEYNEGIVVSEIS